MGDHLIVCGLYENTRPDDSQYTFLKDLILPDEFEGMKLLKRYEVTEELAKSMEVLIDMQKEGDKSELVNMLDALVSHSV